MPYVAEYSVQTHIWLHPQRSIWQSVSYLTFSNTGSLWWHNCRYLRVNSLNINIHKLYSYKKFLSTVNIWAYKKQDRKNSCLVIILIKQLIPTLLQGIYQPYFSAISRIFHISIIREYSLKKESIIFIGTILVRC